MSYLWARMRRWAHNTKHCLCLQSGHLCIDLYDDKNKIIAIACECGRMYWARLEIDNERS